MSYAPKDLVKQLLRNWNKDVALVLADWCEETGLDGFAEGLRANPTSKPYVVRDLRRTVRDMANAIGVSDAASYRKRNENWLNPRSSKVFRRDLDKDLPW